MKIKKFKAILGITFTSLTLASCSSIIQTEVKTSTSQNQTESTTTLPDNSKTTVDSKTNEKVTTTVDGEVISTSKEEAKTSTSSDIPSTSSSKETPTTSKSETPVTSSSKETPVTSSSKEIPATSSSVSPTTSSTSKVEPEIVETSMSVVDYGADQESAYVEFTPVKDATNYNVWVKKTSDSSYTKIDRQLIRKYSYGDSYKFRADAIGISSGVYDLKVTYEIDSVEYTGIEITKLDVISYSREGFAFTSNSYNKTGDASGAYKTDGTLKDDARVLYVTKDNAKTVTLDVITDNKGTKKSFTGIQAIISAYQKGCETRGLAIRFIGEITKSDLDSVGSSSEGLQIKGKALGSVMNMTIEGVGNDAFIHGFGILARNCTNLEIRNLGFATLMDDDVSLDTNNLNIWVHDNDFFYGANGSGDHAKGDGALDIKGTLYATLSYNHFYDTGKTTLNSNKDEVDYVSYHHNWYDHSDSRHPRIRISTAIHIYNNYFDGNAKYGVGVTMGSSAFVEANYFRNCKYPMLSSLQGTDAKGEGTFSSEAGGMIKAYNNTIIYEGAMKGYESNIVYANVANATNQIGGNDSDAYLASTRDEKVPSTYQTVSGGTSYSNFDTDSSIMYSYNVETPEKAKETTMAYSGRIQGGDIKWTFDNSTEDTNYTYIPGLRTLLDNYKNTSLLEVLDLDK